MFERSSWHLLIATTIFACAALCSARVDQSGLNGTVTDAMGRLLPQAHVTGVENATLLLRETRSSADGSYAIPELPVGVYTITVTHPGFKTLTFVDVMQVIGRTRTLNAVLQVASGEERIAVPAVSALMDRHSSAVTGLIEKEQADELPLNGRNWAELTAFVPGAIDTGGDNQQTVRFAGRGLDDSNFTYDGVDATNVVNQTQRQWVRLAIPLDAISQFRVDTLTASAEEGATGGAQLDVTSPSGGNRFHGRLFEYLRNNIFDAPLPGWASAGEAQQPLRLNQFGGSFGGPVKFGPIRRDKTFFFLASEAYRQNWGYPVSGDVPSAAFVAAVPSSSPVYAIMHAFPAPDPHAFLTPWTPANDPGDLNYADYYLLTCECKQVVNESSAMVRLDQHFSAKTTGFLRFNFDRSVNTQPLSATATDLQQKVSTPVNGALQLLHVFDPNLVDEVMVGFNRSTNNQYNSSDAGTDYQISISGGPGPGFFEENYNYKSVYTGNAFSYLDKLTWAHGRQTVKLGAEIRHIQMNQSYGEHGKLTFSSIQNLAANKVKKASLTGALPVNHLRKNDYFLFAQDEVKLRPGLNLNLGVRYTIFDLFHEAEGLANPSDFTTCGAQGYCGAGASFGQQNYGDIDPRVGLAWSPGGSGKTILGAGLGIFHEDGQLDDQNLPAKNEVPSYSASSLSLPSQFPSTAITYGAGTLSPNAEQRDRKDTYVEQWSFSAQRELPANFVGTASYLGSHGVHLLEESYVNLIAPSAITPEYPAFAPAIGWRGSSGMSSYNGLSVAVRRPVARGLLAAANYTWSHEIDNGSNGSGDGDEIQPQNPLCQSCDRTSGVWDTRHVVNGNAVYRLPFGVGKPMLNQPGIASAITGNWELTTTVLARTGFPVNVLMPSSYIAPNGTSGQQRPDLRPGVSLTPPGGRSVTEWINPAAFANPAGECGTAPRDLVRGPGVWQVDLGAAKTFPIRERAQIEFRSEFYNIFNHPQPGLPQSTFNSSNLNGFGSITATVNMAVSPQTPVGSGTPREMQFALRLDF